MTHEPLHALSLWRGPMTLRRGPTMASIAAEVAARHGLTVDDLKGPKTERSVSHPRQEAMARMRAETSCSTTAIGLFLGGRDHSTVISGVKKHLQREGGGE